MTKEAYLSVRPSRFLSLRLNEGRYIAQNHLVGVERVLPLPLVALLASVRDYISAEHMVLKLQRLFPKTGKAAAAVAELVSTGILIEQNGELARQEEQFQEWVWSREAAAHFLATRRVQWMKEADEVEAFGKLFLTKGFPSVWEEIGDDADMWQALGVDTGARKTFELFGKRRSLRQFSDIEITAEALGAILCAGLGIQAFLELPLRPTFPLRFSPSPGALNVFTVYILAANVQGLNPGVYQYNSLLNQVKRIGEFPSSRLSRIFGNQTWADDAAAVCILSADYKKMSWKYSDQSAFNSLLIESGHIAQNMMICAAALSIGSVPTNALDQSAIEFLTFLEFPHQAALYALAFGYEDPSRERDHYSVSTLNRLREIVESTNKTLSRDRHAID
jgi:SagB-type dehydrogenase family enzyme